MIRLLDLSFWSFISCLEHLLGVVDDCSGPDSPLRHGQPFRAMIPRHSKQRQEIFIT